MALASSAETDVLTLEPLTEAEVRAMVAQWYAKLDVHAPAEEVLPFVAATGLEMQLPETTLYGVEQFLGWYEGVIRIFFDEVHELKTVNVVLTPEQAEVDLVVNWQARRWNAPAPNSEWIGFDAAQRWIVKRSPETQTPVIATYIVDALTPMPGSPAL